jgi:hypothetical protein
LRRLEAGKIVLSDFRLIGGLPALSGLARPASMLKPH